MKINFLLFTFTFFLIIPLSLFAQNKKPNIILIVADDLGIGDLGSYGQKKIKTENLDKLAESGIKFTNFYAGTSVCAPSRSSLMTGKHTGHTHIRGNKEIEPEGQEPLADSIFTLAQYLKNAGYTTGAFGKWGLGMIGSTGDPNKKGFDEFYGYICQRQSHRYYPTHLWDNDKKIPLEGNNLQQKVTYAPELIQEKTLAFLNDHKDEPFFLFVPTILPHAELAGPDDKYYKQYENSFEEIAHKGNDYGVNATIAGYASVDKPRTTYASMVSRMDHYVGEIMAKVKELGLEENTIILFTSDNGAHREGGADPDFFNSTAGLRGTKRDLYEGGIKTPLIVSWPGKINPNQTTNHVSAFWDILPTFLELSEAKPIKNTDGISFAPILFNKKNQKKHKYLYWEFHEDGGRQAVLQDNFKLIRQKAKNKEYTYYELFDLNKDPQEKNNIIKSHPKVFKKLLKYMDDAHIESDIFPLLKN